MTCTAVFRRGPVEKYGFAVYRLNQFVTGLAAHLAMRTLQGKRSFLIMIKQRGPPSRAVVTRGAGRYSSFRKLHAVDIRVARLAFCGCDPEIRVDHRCC